MCKLVDVSNRTVALTLVLSLLTVAADAGDAGEDPRSNAHSERRLLTQDSTVHMSLCNWDKKQKRPGNLYSSPEH